MPDRTEDSIFLPGERGEARDVIHGACRPSVSPVWKRRGSSRSLLFLALPDISTLQLAEEAACLRGWTDGRTGEVGAHFGCRLNALCSETADNISIREGSQSVRLGAFHPRKRSPQHDGAGDGERGEQTQTCRRLKRKLCSVARSVACSPARPSPLRCTSLGLARTFNNEGTAVRCCALQVQLIGIHY